MSYTNQCCQSIFRHSFILSTQRMTKHLFSHIRCMVTAITHKEKHCSMHITNYTSEWDNGILLKLVLKLWAFIVEYCTPLTAGGGLVTVVTGWGLYQQFSSLSLLVMAAGGRGEGIWRVNSNCAYSLNWLPFCGLADRGGVACVVLIFILEG